jgi:hypothetical protein
MQTMRRLIIMGTTIAVLAIGFLSFKCYSLEKERDTWRRDFITLEVAMIAHCDWQTECEILKQLDAERERVFEDVGYLDED